MNTSPEEASAILGDVAARIALADFREAMRTPVQTGFFCYRALEAMMQTMKSQASEADKSAWAKLRENLLIDRNAIEFIKNHADWAQHGKIGEINDEERAKIFSLTDAMIYRYIKFISSERNPLNRTEYTTIDINT